MLPAGRNGPVETVTDSSHLGRLSFSFDDGFRLQFHWQVRARRVLTAAAKKQCTRSAALVFSNVAAAFTGAALQARRHATSACRPPTSSLPSKLLAQLRTVEILYYHIARASQVVDHVQWHIACS
jgi:hypothetical protein